MGPYNRWSTSLYSESKGASVTDSNVFAITKYCEFVAAGLVDIYHSRYLTVSPYTISTARSLVCCSVAQEACSQRVCVCVGAPTDFHTRSNIWRPS